MRKASFEDLNNNVQKNRKWVNEMIRKTSSSNRKKRTRSRSESERKALDEISKARWDKAVQKGKIKCIGKRKLYYDYRE